MGLSLADLRRLTNDTHAALGLLPDTTRYAGQTIVRDSRGRIVTNVGNGTHAEHIASAIHDWASGRVAVDAKGNYHYKGESRPVEWNKAARKEFATHEHLTKAAQAEEYTVQHAPKSANPYAESVKYNHDKSYHDTMWREQGSHKDLGYGFEKENPAWAGGTRLPSVITDERVREAYQMLGSFDRYTGKTIPATDEQVAKAAAGIGRSAGYSKAVHEIFGKGYPGLTPAAIAKALHTAHETVKARIAAVEAEEKAKSTLPKADGAAVVKDLRAGKVIEFHQPELKEGRSFLPAYLHATPTEDGNLHIEQYGFDGKPIGTPRDFTPDELAAFASRFEQGRTFSDLKTFQSYAKKPPADSTHAKIQDALTNPRISPEQNHALVRQLKAEGQHEITPATLKPAKAPKASTTAAKPLDGGAKPKKAATKASTKAAHIQATKQMDAAERALSDRLEARERAADDAFISKLAAERPDGPYARYVAQIRAGTFPDSQRSLQRLNRLLVDDGSAYFQHGGQLLHVREGAIVNYQREYKVYRVVVNSSRGPTREIEQETFSHFDAFKRAYHPSDHTFYGHESANEFFAFERNKPQELKSLEAKALADLTAKAAAKPRTATTAGGTKGKALSQAAFEDAVTRAYQRHADNTGGFASINHVRNQVMQETGITRAQFDRQFNDLFTRSIREHNRLGNGRKTERAADAPKYDYHLEPHENDPEDYVPEAKWRQTGIDMAPSMKTLGYATSASADYRAGAQGDSAYRHYVTVSHWPETGVQGRGLEVPNPAKAGTLGISYSGAIGHSKSREDYEAKLARDEQREAAKAADKAAKAAAKAEQVASKPKRAKKTTRTTLPDLAPLAALARATHTRLGFGGMYTYNPNQARDANGKFVATGVDAQRYARHLDNLLDQHHYAVVAAHRSRDVAAIAAAHRQPIAWGGVTKTYDQWLQERERAVDAAKASARQLTRDDARMHADLAAHHQRQIPFARDSAVRDYHRNEASIHADYHKAWADEQARVHSSQALRDSSLNLALVPREQRPGPDNQRDAHGLIMPFRQGAFDAARRAATFGRAGNINAVAQVALGGHDWYLKGMTGGHWDEYGPLTEEEQARHEALAGTALHLLGLDDLVPAYTYHIVGANGRRYVLTSSIPGDHNNWDPARQRDIIRHVPDRDFQRLALGEYLLGIQDRHASNLLYDPSAGKLRAIDFGFSFKANVKAPGIINWSGIRQQGVTHLWSSAKLARGGDTRMTFDRDILTQVIHARGSVLHAARRYGLAPDRLRALEQRFDYVTVLAQSASPSYDDLIAQVGQGDR